MSDNEIVKSRLAKDIAHMRGYGNSEMRIVDVTGRPIAEKLHTFANEMSKEILEAERAKEELASIRATLLVNYNSKTKLDGIEIDESQTTMEMLTTILRSYNIKVAKK